MMGNRKQKWTAEEEAALLAGVAKLGPGKWKNILRDPEFAPSLVNRSNIDLKKRQEVLPNFRSHVGSRLRRLVLQGKLEKVHNTYRINRDAPLRKRPAAPKQMDIQLRLIQSPMLSSHETLQEAAMAAAYKIAEAENKSFLASEAVKEAERVSKMADDSDAMLQLMKEIYGQCSRGERIIPA